MRRRNFITLVGGTAAWPLAAHAQRGDGIRRLGWMGAPRDHPYEKASIAAFREGLSDLGWLEGRNLRIDYRWYAGDGDRYDKDAAELVALAPEVIVGTGGASVSRLLAITRTVPIVFAHVNDPVARGFVASLARPGGNATGFTHVEYQMSAKWLVLLKQIAPNLTRVAVVGNFTRFDGKKQLEAIQSAAASLGVELRPFEVSNAGDIERSIDAFAIGTNNGLIVPESVATFFDHELIVRLAARHRLPAMYNQRYFVDEGGLISYAPNDSSSFRAAAGYVDRVLRGAKPADLPVQQPTKYELVLNLKTAKMLGLTVPTALLVVVDEVVE